MLPDDEWEVMNTAERWDWLRWQVEKLEDRQNEQRGNVKFATDQCDALAHDTLPDLVNRLRLVEEMLGIVSA